MRPEFVEAVKQDIDNKKFRNVMTLTFQLKQQNAETDEIEVLTEYLKSKSTAPTAAVFSTTLSKIDLQQLGEAPFDENGETYAEFGPEYWFKYFWTEVKKEKLGAEETSLLMEAVTSLFDKVEDKLRKRGFRLNLKAGMRATVGAPSAQGYAPTFVLPPLATEAWLLSLTNLLKIGFKAVPASSQPSATSTEQAMLEKDFVSAIKGTQAVRVFWRADGRGRSALGDGARRSVDDSEACGRYGLNQPWHPFSRPENTQYMWFRRGQADNDFYTVVSVTTDVDTACTFPLIDERRAYKMPLKQPSEWTLAELLAHRDNLAEVEVKGESGSRLLIATRTNVYMLAINGGIVLETRRAGACYRGEDKGFPEAGVTGYPAEAFIGRIPIVRVHHGATNADGFTVFPNATDKPELYHTLTAMQHRFGDNGAQEVNRTWSEGQATLRSLVTAWSSYGATKPATTLEIRKLVAHPVSEIRARSYAKTRH